MRQSPGGKRSSFQRRLESFSPLSIGLTEVRMPYSLDSQNPWMLKARACHTMLTKKVRPREDSSLRWNDDLRSVFVSPIAHMTDALQQFLENIPEPMRQANLRLLFLLGFCYSTLVNLTGVLKGERILRFLFLFALLFVAFSSAHAGERILPVREPIRLANGEPMVAIYYFPHWWEPWKSNDAVIVGPNPKRIDTMAFLIRCQAGANLPETVGAL